MSGCLQLAGAALIIVPYLGLQAGRLDPQSPWYLSLNLVGSVMLAVLAGVGHNWGFLLLEGVWAITTAGALIAHESELT